MSDLRPRFWETVPLAQMTRPEWEALCDGCGKCCLNKLEDEDTGEVALTRVACKLLDNDSCQCARYPNRHEFVPTCIVLNAESLPEHMYWLPQTCAYRLLFEGSPLPDWHPLLTNDADSVHTAGVTLRGRMVSETQVAFGDWPDYFIEEPI